jgi:DNA-binding YbaB/EbfC family protein
MFKGIANIAQLMRQAQQMQAKFGEMKDELATVRTEGSSGGGLVVVEATGELKITSIRIEESLASGGDREMMEELVLAAVNQALDRAREAAAEKMKSAAGDIPGISDLLSQSGLSS